MKNVLATVQALAIQTARRTTSLEAFLQNFSGRLKAMGSANELLTAARWRGAAIDHLAAAELGALAPGQTGWEGPELFLTPRAANALALSLHELAANRGEVRGAVRRHRARSCAGRGCRGRVRADLGTDRRPDRRGRPGARLRLDPAGGCDQPRTEWRTTIDYRPAGVVATLRARRAAVAAARDRPTPAGRDRRDLAHPAVSGEPERRAC